MRLSLALVALLAIPLAAHAQTPNQRADREARRYLLPCHQPTNEMQSACIQNQSNFVEEYVLAKAGDLSGMGSTASSFGPHDGDDDVGMPRDQVQSCAWRLVIAELSEPGSYLPAAMVRSGCSPLSGGRLAMAEQRANRLLQELRTSPAKMPDYPPLTPAQRSRLDSTLAPLRPK